MLKLFKYLMWLGALALVYIVFVLAGFYYTDWELRSRFRLAIKNSKTVRDYQLRENLAKDMRELKIPATVSAIEIRRNEQKMEIFVKYKREVGLTWRGKRHKFFDFNFNTKVLETYK